MNLRYKTCWSPKWNEQCNLSTQVVIQCSKNIQSLLVFKEAVYDVLNINGQSEATIKLHALQSEIIRSKFTDLRPPSTFSLFLERQQENNDNQITDIRASHLTSFSVRFIKKKIQCFFFRDISWLVDAPAYHLRPDKLPQQTQHSFAPVTPEIEITRPWKLVF